MRPLTLLTEDMLKRVNAAAIDVQGKADEEYVRRELAKLNSVQEEQQEQMETKADAASTLQAHTAHVQQTQQTFAQLKAQSEQLTQTIHEMEERLAELTQLTEDKADKQELDEMVEVNEAINAQVATLKNELQTTLATLQTWVVESHNMRKTHAIKLQGKGGKGAEGGEAATGRAARAERARMRASWIAQLCSCRSALERLKCPVLPPKLT